MSNDYDLCLNFYLVISVKHLLHYNLIASYFKHLASKGWARDWTCDTESLLFLVHIDIKYFRTGSR